MGLPITVSDRYFKLHFHHKNPADFAGATGQTQACMEETDVVGEPPICHTGYAFLHPEDRYVRETGRKIALADCLRHMGLTRSEREEVWKQYFARGVK